MLLDFVDLDPVNDMLNIFKDGLGAVFKMRLQREAAMIHENLFSSVDILFE